MTRTYRRGIGRRTTPPLDEFVRMALEHGTVFEFMFPPNLREFLEAAWREHQAEILADWEYAGSRPWGAWIFQLIPKYGERRTTKYWARLAEYRDAWLTFGVLHTFLLPPIQESEPEFLDRNGLLSDAERQVLGPIISAEAQFKLQHPRLYARMNGAFPKG